MMSPKKMKYRKQHKGRIHGKATRGTYLSYGEFGLKARMLPTRVLARQSVWVPDVEVLTEGDRYIIRADLPASS